MPIASAKVTSKGQITLPAKLRDELGIRSGDRVDFERNSSGKVEISARTGTLADLKGILAYDGAPLTDDDILALVETARNDRAAQIAARAGGRK